MTTERWYPITDGPNRIVPPIEDDSAFSVDVLVFGYIYDKGAEYSNRPCFALGYVNNRGHWHCHTVNGVFPNNDDPITDYVPLMWQSLPDEPCDVENVLQPAENG